MEKFQNSRTSYFKYSEKTDFAGYVDYIENIIKQDIFLYMSIGMNNLKNELFICLKIISEDKIYRVKKYKTFQEYLKENKE